MYGNILSLVCIVAIGIACCDAECSDTTYDVPVWKTRQESYNYYYRVSCGFFGWSRCRRSWTMYRIGFYMVNEKRNCPTNGGIWMSWSAYSACSRTCGGGTMTRNRTCEYSSVRDCCAKCNGQKTQTQTDDCNTQNCPPVHGGWSEWTEGNWEECPYTCNNESLVRTDTRTCTNPAPAYGGDDCEGVSNRTVTESCKVLKCPVNGGWSNWDTWSTWDSCSTTCDEGVKQRSRVRTCTNPEPANDGRVCEGVSNEEDTDTCTEFECPESRCERIGTDYIDHPDPQKCNQYLQCNAGKLNIMTCPATTAWHNAIKSCDTTATATCLGTCKHGEYESHVDCTKYYHCAGGTKVEISCKDGTRWNADRLVCDHPDNVKCPKESEDETDNDNEEGSDQNNDCSCSKTDPATETMCRSYQATGCDKCTSGQMYAHDKDNCHYYYLCANEYIIQMTNPPQQYWDKTSNTFKVVSQDVNLENC